MQCLLIVLKDFLPLFCEIPIPVLFILVPVKIAQMFCEIVYFFSDILNSALEQEEYLRQTVESLQRVILLYLTTTQSGSHFRTAVLKEQDQNYY